MMNAIKAAPSFVLSAVLFTTPAHSQGVPVTHLSEPERATERGFTKVVGIKELRDGRIILVDEIERLILLLDSELAEVKPIGREGAGPGEYVVPSRLFSLVGDSSAVLDTPNRRLLVLNPDGEPSGVLNFTPGVGTLRASDAQGRFYSSSQGAVRRWTPPSSGLDTVAVYPVWTNPRTREMGGITFTRSEDTNPFPPSPVWAVASSGRTAIVHPDPFRVELFGADGARTEGPVIPFDRIEVTEGHKEQWRENASRPTTVMVRMLRDSPSPPVYGTASGSSDEPTRWPEYLPPFLSGAAMFAPDDRLWVKRTTPVDQPTTFDVFDSEGRRVERTTLPHGRRLIGFGRRAVYAVVRDELDLEYLERYSLGGAFIQSLPDLVEVQVRAAREALRTGGSGWKVLLDPRSEIRKDSVVSLAFDHLVSEGFPVYDQPGIPNSGVRLLSFGGVKGSPDDIRVSAELRGFTSPSSFLNVQGDIHLFRVNCDEIGCSLGDLIVRVHGDGSVSADCWEDYFARSEEERKGCRR